MSTISDETLNEMIDEMLAEDERFVIKGLESTGKCIPYIGWYWRCVDFARVRLGDCGSFIGFMENNKWEYPEWSVTEEQTKSIRAQLCEIVTEPTQAKLQRFFDYIQTCRA